MPRLNIYIYIVYSRNSSDKVIIITDRQIWKQTRTHGTPCHEHMVVFSGSVLPPKLTFRVFASIFVVVVVTISVAYIIIRRWSISMRTINICSVLRRQFVAVQFMYIRFQLFRARVIRNIVNVTIRRKDLAYLARLLYTYTRLTVHILIIVARVYIFPF